MAAIAVLFASAPTMGQELSAVQKQKLDKAKSALNKVSTNLKLAQSTAGGGTAKPKGSKAKLAKLRLDSAATGLPEVKRWLADLPDGNSDVSAVSAALASAEKAITALDARLTGKTPTPNNSKKPVVDDKATNGKDSPTTKPMPETKSETVKLNYQQVDLLKGSKFNLREVEGNSAALTKLVSELKPVKDPLTIDFRVVRTGLNTIDNARRKSKFVKDGLDKLPSNGEGVSETTSRLQSAVSQVDAANKFLVPLNEKLTALIDPANYPELKQDIKRLRELTTMFGNPQIMQTDLPQAAAVLEQSDAANNEVKRIVKAYMRLIQQKTDEGKTISDVSNYFVKTNLKFRAAAESEKRKLPGKIRAHLAEADDISQDAVRNKKPLFFSGGIPSVMGFAKEKIELYTALDPSDAPKLQKEYDDLQSAIGKRAKSLEALIIQQNQLPPNRYKGDDRDKIIAVAVDAWKYQQPKFTVLESCIPSEQWTRETMWRYSNGTWYFVDRSKLQVQLVIADEKDKSLAVIIPVNIWMNHQKGDTMIGSPLFSGDEKLQPNSYLLRSRIK